MDAIKKGIPEYADALINELTKSKTKREIKAILNKQLAKYSNKTFDAQNMSQLNRILLRTNSQDIETARAKVNSEILTMEELLFKEVFLLIFLSVILFAWSGFSNSSMSPTRYILLVISLIILLIAGVTTPTIDMEAKISLMSFELMGHLIQFENQILFFQSKSILDVFWMYSGS